MVEQIKIIFITEAARVAGLIATIYIMKKVFK